MKSFDSNLAAEIAKEAARSFFLIELVFSSTYRYADADIAIWADTGGTAYKFDPFPFQIENIDYTGDLGIDNLTVSLSTVDLTMVSAVLNEDVSHKTVNIYFCCTDSIGVPIATEKIFIGVLTAWEMSNEELRITVANELIHWQKKTLRTCQASCRWVFKGTECGYSGSETWCDKSYDRCTALDRSDYFGGFRFLPAIMDREIWWGRTPK